MNRLLRLGLVAAIAGGVAGTTFVPASAQIPRRISYQALLTQPNGQPVADGPNDIVVRLYDAPTGGNLVYEETQNGVQVTRGLFNLTIGEVTTMAAVDFEQQLYLEVSLVGNAPFSPRTRLTVVPYAVRAERAEEASRLSDDATGVVRSMNGADGDLVIEGSGGITVTTSGDTIRVSADITVTGIQSLGSGEGTINIVNPAGPNTMIDVADGAITAAKLGGNAVGTTNIQNGAVTADKIASGVIPTTLPPSGAAGGDLTGTYPNPAIQTNAVTTGKIADGAVTTGKLADGSVSNTKLADNSVGTSKVQDGAITTSKLSNTGVTPGTYGSNLMVPRIEVDAKGRITSATMVPIPDIPYTGPAGGDLTGTYPNPQIRPNAIDNNRLADNAVSTTKIQNDAVTGAKIQDGTITTADLAPGVIPTTLPPSGPAGGVLSGTYPNPGLAVTSGNAVLAALNNGATTGTIADARLNTTGVAPGSYGTGGLIPIITVDAYGRITSVGTSAVTSATPTGPASGDLQGTYPAPILNPSAAAGGRIVDAIRNDYLAGDADINSANNIVVLNGSGQLPAVSGALLTNLNAANITAGVLPIQFGGTNSSTSLVNNRFMVSSGGRIVEAGPLNSGQFFIGTGPSSMPAPGSITAGAGINVTFTAPNFVISSTDARILPGTANDQTVRWDAVNQQWVPNANLLATAGGAVTANGNLLVNGTTTLVGNVALGTTGLVNSFGTAAGATNSIGAPTTTNFVYGTTNINTNTDAPTNIGNGSSPSSSTTISVGTGGNLTLLGIDVEVPTDFLLLNGSSQVRRASASSLALEGVQWQNGAFRLGGENATTNPLLSTRYINLDDENLVFTRINGAGTMVTFSGAGNTVNVTATTNINTTGGLLTTIGNPLANTVIGGQLDPRGIIQNTAGNVVIMDQTEVIGATFINVATNDNVEIGNTLGAADQTITLAVGQGANGNLVLNNIKNDPTPLYMLSLNGSNQTRVTLLADMADEGIQYQNGAFRLGAGASEPQPLRAKSYDEDRYVNLDAFAVSFTNGSEGADGVTFFQLDGDVGGAPRVQATALTNINVSGAAATNIGNLAAGGPVTVLSNGLITTSSNTGNIVTTALAGTISETAAANITMQAGANLTGNATDIVFTATNDFTATAGNDANLTAGNNANVTATVDVNVQADNDVNVLADNDVDIESINDYRVDVGNNSTINVTNDETVTVGNTYALTAPTANVNATGTGLTQVGNGTGGVAAGRVGVGAPSATAVYNSTHGVPVVGNVLLDVNGTGGQPNVRIGSLSANHPTVYDNLIDGVVVADNNGVLRRVPEVTIIDANNGLVYNETGTDYDVRLGTLAQGNAAANRPLESNRYVNLNNWTLGFNRGAGADLMLTLDGAADMVDVNALTVNVNATGANTTNIGAAGATNNIDGTTLINDGVNNNTSINTGASTGSVLIGNAASTLVDVAAITVDVDATTAASIDAPTLTLNTAAASTTNIGAAGGTNTVLGTTSVNATGNNATQIGNGLGAAANVGIGEAAIGTHLLTVNGTPQTSLVAVPNVRIDHLGGDALTTAYPNPDATNGFVMSDASGDLRKYDEATVISNFAWMLTGNTTTAPNNIFGTLNATDVDIRTNNLNRMTLAANGDITVGNLVSGGNIDVVAAGANTIDVTGTTNVNTTGSQNTTIGNGGSTTAINGPTLINNNVNSNTSINTGTSTGTVTIGNAAAGAVSLTSSANITNTTTATFGVNANTFDVNGTVAGSIDAPALTINTAAPSTTTVGATGGTNAIIGTTTINESNNENTSINTGTSTGTVTIGNVAAGAASVTSGVSITASAPTINVNQATAGTTNIGTAGGTNNVEGNTNINATSNGATTIGAGATAGNVTIGSTAGTNSTTLQSRGGGDVTVDVDNANNSDLRINGLANALGTEDVLMIQPGPGNEVRRYAGTPGVVFGAAAADYTFATGAATADVPGMTVTVANPGTYEVEVVIYHSTDADNLGLAEFAFLDVALQSSTVTGAVNYGLSGSSGGYSIEPGSVNAIGAELEDIGLPVNPNVRGTLNLNGTVIVSAGTPGNIRVQVGENEALGFPGRNVTIHSGSYIKVTRVQ